MRIVHIIDFLPVGGAQKLLLSFAQVAQRRGITMTVIALYPVIPESHIQQTLRALGVEVIEFNVKRLLDFWQFVRIVRYLRRAQFDVVHTHLSYATIIGTVAARMAGTPVVASIHSASRVQKPAIDHLEAHVMQVLVDRIVAVGQVVVDAHTPYMPRKPMDVIRNAVEEIAPLAADERKAVRQELCGSDERPIIVSVGRFSEYKRFDDLITAMTTVVSHHPDVFLAIAGDGALFGKLAAQVAEAQLDGHVGLLGVRNDVPRLLAASDMYVSASRIEGLPIAVLEAMAAGLPVVVTSVGEVPLIVSEKQGTLVPPCEPEHLASAIVAMLDDPARMRACGAAGRAYIRQHHTLDRWFDEHLDLYQQVIRKGKRQ